MRISEIHDKGNEPSPETLSEMAQSGWRLVKKTAKGNDVAYVWESLGPVTQEVTGGFTVGGFVNMPIIGRVIPQQDKENHV